MRDLVMVTDLLKIDTRVDIPDDLQTVYQGLPENERAAFDNLENEMMREYGRVDAGALRVARQRFLREASRSKIVRGDCWKHGAYQAFSGNGQTWEGLCPECTAETEERKQEEKRAAECLQAADIPPLFKGATFDNWESKNREQAEAIARVKAWVDYYMENPKVFRCLTLCGNNGSGKTHAAVAVVRSLVSCCIRARFVAADSIGGKIRSTYGGNGDSEAGVFRRFTSPAVLVLDDVGATQGTSFEISMTQRVIAERYNLGKPVIVTTNLTPPQISDYLGQMCLDRLMENYGAFVRMVSKVSHRRT